MNSGTSLPCLWLGPCCIQQYNIAKIRNVIVVVKNAILKFDSSLQLLQFLCQIHWSQVTHDFQYVKEIIYNLGNSERRPKTFEAKVLRRINKIAKNYYQLFNACPSVRPHGTTLLPQDGFSCNFIFEDFSKICRGSSRFIKIWQE